MVHIWVHKRPPYCGACTWYWYTRGIHTTVDGVSTHNVCLLQQPDLWTVVCYVLLYICCRLSRTCKLIRGSMNWMTSYLNCCRTANMLPTASAPTVFITRLFKQCSALPYRSFLTSMSMHSLTFRLLSCAYVLAHIWSVIPCVIWLLWWVSQPLVG